MHDHILLCQACNVGQGTIFKFFRGYFPANKAGQASTCASQENQLDDVGLDSTGPNGDSFDEDSRGDRGNQYPISKDWGMENCANRLLPMATFICHKSYFCIRVILEIMACLFIFVI